MAKPPIKTAKQENGVCEETAKEATGAKTLSLATVQPTPPPRRRRSSGQRWQQLQTDEDEDCSDDDVDNVNDDVDNELDDDNDDVDQNTN